MAKNEEKKYIYIDDSGDPGLKNSSSKFFIIAAVIVEEQEKKELDEKIAIFKRNIKWRENTEFKFNKTNRKYIEQLIRNIENVPYDIYAVVLDKIKVSKGIIKMDDNRYTFLFVIKELLEKIGFNNSNVIIDGIYGKKFIKNARTYLRKNLNHTKANNYTFRFVDSRKYSLIQLADIAAGAIANSLSTKGTNKFVDLLENKIKNIYEL